MTTQRHALSELLLPVREANPPGPQGPTHEASPTAPAREAGADPLGEVITLCPAHLAQLPLATTLLLACGAETLVVTSGRDTHAELAALGLPVITARGLCHLAAAAEAGRASHEALASWLQAGEPLRGVILIDSVAYGGAYALETPIQKWPLSRVLAAWGLTLVGVSVGEGTNSEVLA